MRLFTRAFIIGTIALVPTIACADISTYVFFDIENCKQFQVTNEPSGNPNDNQWWEKAEKLNGLEKSLGDGLLRNWSVFGMNERLGLCSETLSNKEGVTELHCLNESHNRFPLAGANYKMAKNKKGERLWFVCSSGCDKGVPKILYTEGDEPLETDRDFIELKKVEHRFEMKCPSN